MDILLLLGLIALLFVPSFLMMRKQRHHQAKMAEMQDKLQIGDYVVTGAGLHGRIAEVGESTVDVEIAPQTVVTMERISVMRNVTSEAQQMPEAGATGADTPAEGDHPENYR